MSEFFAIDIHKHQVVERFWILYVAFGERARALYWYLKYGWSVQCGELLMNGDRKSMLQVAATRKMRQIKAYTTWADHEPRVLGNACCPEGLFDVAHDVLRSSSASRASSFVSYNIIKISQPAGHNNSTVKRTVFHWRASLMVIRWMDGAGGWKKAVAFARNAWRNRAPPFVAVCSVDSSRCSWRNSARCHKTGLSLYRIKSRLSNWVESKINYGKNSEIR